MSTFIQIHALTFYPPSNLNRDDLGRPKSATVGGVNRLRISSQCLKRTWRTSDVFKDRLQQYLGKRTRVMGSDVVTDRLMAGGISEEDAHIWASLMMQTFAKVATKDDEETGKGQTKQTVHFNLAEREAIDAMADRIVNGELTLKKTGKGKNAKTTPMEDGNEYTIDLRRNSHKTVDIAMFGRMLAEHPGHNMDAAVQVSHAITVNKVHLEDDFFTAVDDLQKDGETGSAHMGETWFGSGIYYLYVCINRDLLLKNLGDDEALLQDALNTLTRAITTLAPSGKQNSFAAHSRCGFVYAEKGSAQPRSLSMAFIKPVSGQDLMTQAVKAFNKTQKQLDEAYEIQNDAKRFYPLAADGEPSDLKTLTELADFVAGPAA